LQVTTPDDYDRHDGLGLAELVARGEVTPAELCEEAIRRAESLNPRLNAIVTPMYDIGRKTASGPLEDGPFRGVPFLLKDILHAWAGVPMSHGSAALRDYVPDYDSEIVRRFRAAGLVVLGKTNTPEFALMGVTEPEAFGPTRNPWNPEYTPGGSSGGSAAAVAAGIVPLASATDGGGSIRIPAACCGLFGLRPSRGRVPVGPAQAEVWDGASSDHVLTRTVRDSAAMLDAIRGPDDGAPYRVAPPERPYLEEVRRDPGHLRIGFNTTSPLGLDVHPECVRAVEETAQLLEDLGHRAEPAAPDVDGPGLAKSYMTMYFGQVAADIRELIERVGRGPTLGGLEPATRALGLLGQTVSAGDYVAAKRRWNDFGRAMGTFYRSYDLYLTPTLAQPPARIGELQPSTAERFATRVINALGLGRVLLASGVVDKLASEGLSRTPFTQLANLAGLPAMSLPLHWTADGLPCGVQFIAPMADEATLFRLAGQLEQARPWFDRRPDMSRANG